MIKLSVVIVSYKNLDVLKDCLDSIHKYNDIGNQLEVIVVEQSPEETIYDYIKKNYEDIIIIRNSNAGFGAGNNRGTEFASGEYLLFLNPDTILVEPIFSYAIKIFKQNPNLGLFGFKLIDKHGNLNLSYNYIINFGIAQILYRKIKKQPNFSNKKMYINGADIFIRNKLFRDIGKFDENIFMYGEEADICLRLKHTNYTVGYFDEKRIAHLEGGTTDFKPTVYEKLCKSFVYVCDKHGIKWKNHFLSEYMYYKIRLSLKLYKSIEDKKILEYRAQTLKRYLCIENSR